MRWVACLISLLALVSIAHAQEQPNPINPHLVPDVIWAGWTISGPTTFPSGSHTNLLIWHAPEVRNFGGVMHRVPGTNVWTTDGLPVLDPNRPVDGVGHIDMGDSSDPAEFYYGGFHVRVNGGRWEWQFLHTIDIWSNLPPPEDLGWPLGLSSKTVYAKPGLKEATHDNNGGGVPNVFGNYSPFTFRAVVNYTPLPDPDDDDPGGPGGPGDGDDDGPPDPPDDDDDGDDDDDEPGPPDDWDDDDEEDEDEEDAPETGLECLDNFLEQLKEDLAFDTLLSLLPDRSRDFSLTFDFTLPGAGEITFSLPVKTEISGEDPGGVIEALDVLRRWVRLGLAALLTVGLVRAVITTMRQY